MSWPWFDTGEEIRLIVIFIRRWSEKWLNYRGPWGLRPTVSRVSLNSLFNLGICRVLFRHRSIRTASRQGTDQLDTSTDRLRRTVFLMALVGAWIFMQQWPHHHNCTPPLIFISNSGANKVSSYLSLSNKVYEACLTNKSSKPHRVCVWVPGF